MGGPLPSLPIWEKRGRNIPRRAELSLNRLPGILLRHDYIEDGEERHVLLFANPNSKERRNNITIKVSFDDGQTWPEEYWTLLDEGRGAGYSCMTSIDEHTIGIFYEGSQADIQFQAIPLKELLKK